MRLYCRKPIGFYGPWGIYNDYCFRNHNLSVLNDVAGLARAALLADSKSSQ